MSRLLRLFLLLVTFSAYAGQPTDLDQEACRKALEARNPKAAKTLEAAKKINEIIAKVKKGEMNASAIPLTPPGKLLSLGVTKDNSYSYVSGSLIEVRQSNEGPILVVMPATASKHRLMRFLSKTKPWLINIANVTDAIEKPLLPKDNATRVLKALQAAKPGMGISYLSWHFQSITESVVKAFDGKSLTVSHDGAGSGYGIGDSVDADSILLFEIKPNALNAEEEKVLAILNEALKKQAHVRFMQKTREYGLQFKYGEVTSLNVAVDGTMFVHLGKDESYKVSTLVLDSLSLVAEHSLQADPTEVIAQLVTAKALGKAVAYARYRTRFLDEQTEFQGVISSIERPPNGNAKIRILDDKKEEHEIDANTILPQSILIYDIAAAPMTQTAEQFHGKLLLALADGKKVGIHRRVAIHEVSDFDTNSYDVIGKVQKFETGVDGLIRVYILDEKSRKLQMISINKLTKVDILSTP